MTKVRLRELDNEDADRGRLRKYPVNVSLIYDQEFSRILASDIARWGEVAKAANIKMEQ